MTGHVAKSVIAMIHCRSVPFPRHAIRGLAMLPHSTSSLKRWAAVGLVLALVLGVVLPAGIAGWRLYRFRRAVSFLREGTSRRDAEWAIRYFRSTGKRHLSVLVDEAAKSENDRFPYAVNVIAQPVMSMDPTDPGDPLRLLFPMIPVRRFRVRKLAVFRIYAGNQPEYIDYLLAVLDQARSRPADRALGRLALSSLRIAVPREDWATWGIDSDLGDEPARISDTQMEKMRVGWRAARTGWEDSCYGHEVSGTDPFREYPTFTDAELWNAALGDDIFTVVPPPRQPTPPGGDQRGAPVKVEIRDGVIRSVQPAQGSR